MKNKKIFVATAPKFNWKILESGKMDIPPNTTT